MSRKYLTTHSLQSFDQQSDGNSDNEGPNSVPLTRLTKGKAEDQLSLAVPQAPL